MVPEEKEFSKQLSEFWRRLGVEEARAVVTSAEDGGDDIEFEKGMDARIVLYGLESDGDTFTILAANARSLSSKLINSGGVFVLDVRGDCVSVWCGRHSNESDRELGAQFAQMLANEQDPIAPVYLERDVGESVMFMETFPDWNDGVTIEVKAARNVKVKDKTRYIYDRGGLNVRNAEGVDIEKMYNPPPPPASWERNADGTMVDGSEEPGGPPPLEADRGKLDLTVWIAAGSEIVAVPEEEYGILYSGECYLLRYRHLSGREGAEREDVVVYYWIGDHCKPTEQATVAYNAVEIEKKTGARQVRVTQGREPPHFLTIFRTESGPVATSSATTSRPMIVRTGQRSRFSAAARALYHVSGFDEEGVRIVEAAWERASVNTGSCFVVCRDGRTFVWVGEGACTYEIAAAMSAAERMAHGSPVTKVEEDSFEPKPFWSEMFEDESLLVADTQTASAFLKQKASLAGAYRCRLFRISHVLNGHPTAEEVVPFAPSDLDQASIYVLDAFFEIYVWVGSEARSDYRNVRLALETALAYAQHAWKKETGRKKLDGAAKDGEKRNKVWMVESGGETPGFRSAFVAFDDGYEDVAGSSGILDEMRKTPRNRRKALAKAVPVNELLETMEKAVYTLEELRKKDDLPLGVDPSHVEQYLSTEDFTRLFKCTAENFRQYPQWKQMEMKRKVDLF